MSTRGNTVRVSPGTDNQQTGSDEERSQPLPGTSHLTDGDSVGNCSQTNRYETDA